MSLRRLLWSDTSAQDVHLLPGLVSPQFTRLLRAGNFDPATKAVTEEQLHNMPGLTVSFAAQLAGTLDSHGLDIDAKTGAITVKSDVPVTTKGHSFLVTVTGQQGTVKATTRIRVYVHGAILRLWLTPSRLTVRKGAKNVRLSVLAMFDDGVIGDITNWSPFEPNQGPADLTYVHAKSSDTPALKWSDEPISPGGASPVGVHEVTGVLTAISDAGSAKITVQGRGHSANATAVCAPPWTTPVPVTHLKGPGVKDMKRVRNILFLPDGFQTGEQPEFARQVRRVVWRLSLRNRTRPFGALAGRMNYFMAWVPSPDAGVSVLNEIDRDRLAVNTGSSLELPSPQRPQTTKWTLPELINEVGLPTPLGDAGVISLADRVQGWKALYGPQVEGRKMQHLHAAWLACKDRVLLNERDTAFHRAFGERPSAEEDVPGHALGFNPRRLHDDDFAAFLDALFLGPGEPPQKGSKDQELPKVWSTGEDSKLVVFLCRSNHIGGSNIPRPAVVGQDPGRTISVSLAPSLTHRVQRNQHDNGWDLIRDPFPPDPHYHVWLTTVHELGHSCELGEEYAGSASPPPPARIADTAKKANIQSHDTLLAAGVLRSDNIKWRWPRIAKASALFAKPEPVPGGKFRLDLTGKARPGFATGDVVRLRTRPLATSTGPSGRFKVESVTPTGDSLVIVPLPGTVADPATFPNLFPARSVVMMPVRAHDPNPAANQFGDDLGMVTDEMLVRINFTNNPLNARPLLGEAPPPNDVASRPCANVELPYPTAATNFSGGLKGAPKPPTFPPWIIGLYENGGMHNCGIYRPTGVCLMSSKYKVDRGTVFQYEYCQVCRYVVVDTLDPTGHADVEQDYRDRYGP